MAEAGAPYIVYGGTFDPVHDGHLLVARAARDLLGGTVHLLPAREPPLRERPATPAADRLAMLELAVAGEPGLAIDPRELARPGPSWTVDTVAELRRELGPARPLVLVIGMDALAAFTRWQRWADILAQAHLLACARPGQATAIPAALAGHAAADPRELLRNPGGRIVVEPGTAANIAATEIRQQLAAGHTPAGLAPAVLAYIRQHHLYQPGGDSRGARDNA